MTTENIELEKDTPLFPEHLRSQWVERTEDTNPQTYLPGFQEISLEHPERFIVVLIIVVCLLSLLAMFA